MRNNAKAVETALNGLDQSEREALADALNKEGMISTNVPASSHGKLGVTKYLNAKRARVENIRKYTPNVIEPSFGIRRMFYCLLEHVYWHRPNDVARGVRACFSFLKYQTALNIPGTVSAA